MVGVVIREGGAGAVLDFNKAIAYGVVNVLDVVGDRAAALLVREPVGVVIGPSRDRTVGFCDVQAVANGIVVVIE